MCVVVSIDYCLFMLLSAFGFRTKRVGSKRPIFVGWVGPVSYLV
jgi:hypothetical protein